MNPEALPFEPRLPKDADVSVGSTSGMSAADRLLSIAQALECPLCLSLICEPISISCGHSFCRVCLVKSLRRSKKKCPQCRAVCHVVAEDAEENIMLKALSIATNPSEYQSRLAEAEVEKSSWTKLLPIFYYNDCLYPGSTLGLHLFEPRYRLMMQRVVNTTRSFAYVPNFANYRADVGDVALIAQLVECEFLADGRALLQAKITTRHKITDHFVEEGTQGLHYCRLGEAIRDDPIVPGSTEDAELRVLLQAAQTVVRGLFRMNGVKDMLETRFGPVPAPSDPEGYSLWLCGSSPIKENREKLRLLASTDTVERFKTALRGFEALAVSRNNRLRQNAARVDGSGHGDDPQEGEENEKEEDDEEEEEEDEDDDDDDDGESMDAEDYNDGDDDGDDDVDVDDTPDGAAGSGQEEDAAEGGSTGTRRA